MFTFLEKAVMGMAMLRVLSGSIEICAALFMLRFNNIEKALIINSSLSLVGPLVLIATTTIGLYGLSGKISLLKMILIFSGVALILYGVKSK